MVVPKDGRQLEINRKEEVNLIDLDWQVGSKNPPKVCLCCGFTFDAKVRKRMGPYLDAPYIWICSDCYSKDFLHCPGKDTDSIDLKVMASIKKDRKSVRNQNAQRICNLSETTVNLDKGMKTAIRYIPLIDLKLGSTYKNEMGTALKDFEIENILWEEPSIKQLYEFIVMRRGFIDPLLIDSNNKVLDNDKMLVCLRRLSREIRNDVIRDIPISKIDPLLCHMIISETNNKTNIKSTRKTKVRTGATSHNSAFKELLITIEKTIREKDVPADNGDIEKWNAAKKKVDRLINGKKKALRSKLS